MAPETPTPNHTPAVPGATPGVDPDRRVPGSGPDWGVDTRARVPLKRTLLVSVGLLFIGAVVLSSLGLFLVLPFLSDSRFAILAVLLLLLGGLIILYSFGNVLLRRSLLDPMSKLVADAQRIAGGEYRHKIGPADTAELQALSDAVNAMAARLIHDQELLAENIRSLEETNRELIEAGDEVVRSARLASVGTLASGIAHEVGNPLSAIMGFVDLARNRLGRGDMDPEILDAIMDEARRIDRIVRSLLNYSRPRDEETRPFDAGEVIERVRDLLDTQGRFDQVETTWRREGNPPLVAMNPHRLEQVLVNLLLNALDAIEGQQDGHIEVSVRAEEGELRRAVSRREDDPPGINYTHRRRLLWGRDGTIMDAVHHADRVVLIAVRDNGPGIPPENIEQLFDPFFTTKAPGKGTGLGLAVCARLVEGMGGRIEGGNDPKGGARFVIRLPAVPPTPSEPLSSDTQTTGVGD